MVEGFVAAAGRWVRSVPGGVVRSGAAPGDRTVAVVIGGGSGHYPAFGGLVGRGLAHGAAMGNLFSSPSASQVYSVASAADQGGGVLFSYGNYAGDVLNFDQAQDRLRNEGVVCETVVVTDDISSASLENRHRRRGIAGGLVVYKVAGAASDRGDDLVEVARLARKANERTRTLGVAFTGCTLPGATEPLFTVPEARMAVGMGVHGEPGVDETDVPTADALADLLVDRLLGEVPRGAHIDPSGRVAVILNGLGSVKYEELFVVYRRVAERLEGAGIVVVEPEVGELITSFDMAGASLTLSWLDEELEVLWRAAADAPAYRKGLSTLLPQHVPAAPQPSATTPDQPVPPAEQASQDRVEDLLRGMRAAASVITRQRDALGRLDAVVGDGDHGIGMVRGIDAAVDAIARALARGAGLQTALSWASRAWADEAGGTSGALWGVAIRAVAVEVSDQLDPTASDIRRGVQRALDAIREAGHADIGDRTMIDALAPFASSLARRLDDGADLASAWSDSAVVADEAAAATATMLPRRGRATTHGAKALGTPDAGAVSLALVLQALTVAFTPPDDAGRERLP